MFTVNKYQALVAGAVALIAAGWGYGQYKYGQGRMAAKQEQEVINLRAYKQAADDLLAASQAAQGALTATQAKFNSFTEAYQNEMRTNPIDCIGTDGRLRSILELYPSETAGKPR